MKFNIFFVCLFKIAFVFADTNPFRINFPEKIDLTNEDYVEVQSQLRSIKIEPLLRSLYVEGCLKPGFTGFDDFYGRCHKCIQQNLIDVEKGLYPTKELVKIGNGGDRCIVSCGPLSGKYPQYIKSLIQGLKDVGFNGHLFYMIGGWPNPTGKEIRYAAVPYSFKIFTMGEAYKLGFSNVLWIDAACYPLRNIEILFKRIERNGALLNWYYTYPDAFGYIFPQTRELLQKLTGTDVLNAKYINTIVFGLNMNTKEAQELVTTYYRFAEMGTPFLSCFPEEWVLTAIIGQKKFARWRTVLPPPLIKGSITNQEDSPKEFDLVRKQGVYFYHRKGR